MTPPRGVGLVEVAVALVVLSVGWAAVVGLHRLTLDAGLRAAVDDEARWTVQAVADSLDLGGGGTGRRDTPWGRVTWRGEAGGVLVEAWSARDGRIAALWTAGGAP
ncbi:MAG: hypothetical protein RLN75_09185 [Longimicrobiales bacterium]